MNNNLLYQHQYGFLPKGSTEQNLIQLVNYIAEAINENMYCIGVFLDIKKAFDVCSHDILLAKLQKMVSSKAICKAEINVLTLEEFSQIFWT